MKQEDKESTDKLIMQLIVSKVNWNEITIETSSPYSNSLHPPFTIEDLQMFDMNQTPNKLNVDSPKTAL